MRLPSSCAITRIGPSTAPPGENGTITFTGSRGVVLRRASPPPGCASAAEPRRRARQCERESGDTGGRDRDAAGRLNAAILSPSPPVTGVSVPAKRSEPASAAAVDPRAHAAHAAVEIDEREAEDVALDSTRPSTGCASCRAA